MKLGSLWKRSGLWLLLLLVLALPVSAAQDREDEAGEQLPVKVWFEPLGRADLEEAGLLAVEQVPFSGSTYGESLEEGYPEAYGIYQDMEDYFAQPMGDRSLEWVDYMESNGQRSRMLTWKIPIDSAGIDDVEDAIFCAVAAYANDHPMEKSLWSGYLIWSLSWSECYIAMEVFHSTQWVGPELDKEEVESDLIWRRELLTGAVDDFEESYWAAMDDDASDVERYRYIHDYLCDRLRYNYDALWAATSNTPELKNAHNAFGALVGLKPDGNGGFSDRGYVVCQGYSEAYLLLCQRVGLPCIVVIGAGNGNSTVSDHMWNAAYVDEQWYCLDVTWDDVDEVDQTSMYWSGILDYSTADYQYFLNNDYFVGGAKDHNILVQSNYPQCRSLRAPEMRTGTCLEKTLPPQRIEVRLRPKAGKGTVELDDALHLVEHMGRGGFWFRDIPQVKIVLTCDATLSRQCTVAADKEYEITGENHILNRGYGFDGELFYVENNGTLLLSGLELKGSTGTASPLISTGAAQYTEATGWKRGEITLEDVVITGNDGAEGVYADAYLRVRGRCRIDGSWIDATPANLKLGPAGYICVTGALSDDSMISVTTESGEYFAGTAEYAWTAEDRMAFFPDDGNQALVYDQEEEVLYAYQKQMTDGELPLSVTYVPVPKAQMLGECRIKLTNRMEEEREARVWVAGYDEAGRMTQLVSLDSVTLPGGGESEEMTLPELADGSSYRLFTLDEGWCPLAERVRYDFGG